MDRRFVNHIVSLLFFFKEIWKSCRWLLCGRGNRSKTCEKRFLCHVRLVTVRRSQILIYSVLFFLLSFRLFIYFFPRSSFKIDRMVVVIFHHSVLEMRLCVARLKARASCLFLNKGPNMAKKQTKATSPRQVWVLTPCQRVAFVPAKSGRRGWGEGVTSNGAATPDIRRRQRRSLIWNVRESRARNREVYLSSCFCESHLISF